MKPSGGKSVFIACLCAEWCSSCRAYRATFDALARERRELAEFAWIDVEDHPDVMGDLEIETFPTVLIAIDGSVIFFGPVMPQAAPLAALAERAARGELSQGHEEVVSEVAARAIALARI